MLAYIARRLLLMIPTLFGIMLISFVIVQFAPGGPVERIIAQLQGTDAGATCAHLRRRPAISPAAQAQPRRRRRTRRPRAIAARRGSTRSSSSSSSSSSASTSRRMSASLKMLWDYARFDFGKSYFRDVSVLQLITREAAGLDHARPVDDAPLLRHLDPARHPQGGARRLPLRRLDLGRRHRRLRHPGLPVRHPAHRALRRRLVLADLPAARPAPPRIGPSSRSGRRSSTISGTSRCRSPPWRSAPSPPRRS